MDSPESIDFHGPIHVWGDFVVAGKKVSTGPERPDRVGEKGRSAEPVRADRLYDEAASTDPEELDRPRGKRSSARPEQLDRLLVLSMLRPLARPPFVDSAPFASTVQELRNERIVCVQGSRNTGRRTSVVRGLSDLDLEVGEVDPRHSLAAIVESRIPQKAGLLFDQSVADALVLHDYELNRLDQALAASESRMVILASPSTRLSFPEQIPIIPWHDGPSAPEITFSWIVHHLGAPPSWTSVNDLREAFAVHELFIGPSDAAILASLAVRSEESDQVATAIHQLTEGRSDRVADRTSNLLENSEIQDIALLIATLVLSGSPEPVILDAATELEHSLVGAYPDAPVSKLPFGRALGARVAHLDLRRTSRIDATLPGRPEPTFALKDPSVSSTMLQHVWFEYGLQETLSEWMTTLANRASLDVTINLATAAAQLFVHSPAVIFPNVLRQWSTSDSSLERFAASLCLGLAATTFAMEPSQLLPEVQRLNSAPDWRRRWTAVSSMGLGVGQRFPRLALATFDNAASDTAPYVGVQAVSSLQTILGSWLETPKELQDFVALLCWWIDDGQRGPIRRALAAVALSGLLDEAETSLWTPMALAEIAPLVGRLLSRQDSRQDGQRILRFLLERLPFPGAPSTYRRIAERLAQGERGKPRLAFLLTRLQSSRDGHVRNVASALMKEP